MKNKMITTIFLLSVCFLVGYGQGKEDPISWTFKFKEVGSEYLVSAHAKIEKGWKVYGIDFEGEGPVKTMLDITNDSDFQKVGGQVEGIPPQTGYDPLFGITIAYYKDKACINQKIKATGSGENIVRGYIRYMSCNDQTCLPPRKAHFAFDVTTGKLVVE